MFRSLASSSSGNLYTLDDGRTRLLIEAGLPFSRLQYLLDYQVSSYAACIISHSHADHSRSAQELIQRGMDVWCSKDTALALGIEADAQRAVPGYTFKVGSFTVLPFDAVHDVPCMGYLIASVTGGKLLYAIDTCYLPNRFVGLTEIAVECNHSRELLMASSIPDSQKERIMKTHMSIEVFLKFLRANDLSKVQTIYLLHMSDSRGDAEEAKRKVQEETGCMVTVC